MHENTEKYYLDRILKDDKQAYKWIVDKYKDMVYTLCIRMMGSEVEAEEAAQDVFLKVYNSLSSFQGSSKLSTWIYRICYNHCISLIRKRVKMIDLVDEMPLNSVDENSLDALQELKAEERSLYIQNAIESLAETDALVLTLYYFDDQSLDEIVEITGLSSSNVRVKLHRARQKIYAELNSQLKSELNSIL